MKRFLLAIAIILAAFLFTAVRVQDEDKEYELVKNPRQLNKELGERPCGPYFTTLDYGGRVPSLSFHYFRDGQPQNEVFPKSRLNPPVINDKKLKPVVRFGTNEEGRKTGLFVLNAKDYEEARGCLPEPKK